MPGRRPEALAPPDLFYNETEARKYTNNTRMIAIQRTLSERAIELLALSRPSVVLDVGCGSGLSGECLSEHGHFWVGIDISEHMLHVAKEREVDGELLRGDIGDGLPFRTASFDTVIGISVLQWLCNAERSSDSPVRRLRAFFTTLLSCVGLGARCVFQIYPETPAQLELINRAATRGGFSGGVVVDFPDSTKARKFFLVLFASGAHQPLPAARVGEADVPESIADAQSDSSDSDGEHSDAESGDDEEDAEGSGSERSATDSDEDSDDGGSSAAEKAGGARAAKRARSDRSGEGADPMEAFLKNASAAHNRQREKERRPARKSRKWILEKKERERRQGKSVRPDTRYTGRKRKPRF